MNGLDKLIKLLELTKSDNDYEALSSIRIANSILKKNNYSWNMIFDQKVKIEYVEVPFEINRNLREKLDFLLDRLDSIGNASDFIISLNSQYEQRGALTEKQMLAVEKFYENLSSRRFY